MTKFQSSLILIALFLSFLAPHAYGQRGLLVTSIGKEITRTLVAPEIWNRWDFTSSSFKRIIICLTLYGIAGMEGKDGRTIERSWYNGLPFQKLLRQMNVTDKLPSDAAIGEMNIPNNAAELNSSLLHDIVFLVGQISDNDGFLNDLTPAAKTKFYTAIVTSLYRARSAMLSKFLGSSPSPNNSKPVLQAYAMMTRLLRLALDPSSDELNNYDVGINVSYAFVTRKNIENLQASVGEAVKSEQGNDTAVRLAIAKALAGSDNDLIRLYLALGGPQMSDADAKIMQELYEAHIRLATTFNPVLSKDGFPKGFTDFVRTRLIVTQSLKTPAGAVTIGQGM